MDRDYEGWDTQSLDFEWGCNPVVLPKKSRNNPWAYDKELYKQRNEAERVSERLKGDRDTVRQAGRDVFCVYLSPLVCYLRLFIGFT
jgi:hypothetical protein